MRGSIRLPPRLFQQGIEAGGKSGREQDDAIDGGVDVGIEERR